LRYGDLTARGTAGGFVGIKLDVAAPRLAAVAAIAAKAANMVRNPMVLERGRGPGDVVVGRRRGIRGLRGSKKGRLTSHTLQELEMGFCKRRDREKWASERVEIHKDPGRLENSELEESGWIGKPGVL
jgi:hypothetical protein